MTFDDYSSLDPRMEYFRPFSKAAILDRLLKSEQYYLRKYVRLLRAEEHFTFRSNCRLGRYLVLRKKNALGAKLGFFIPAGCFGPDLKIAHYGSIIVNPHARIGSGCTIHGNCCIGNKGLEPSDNDSPIVGNNVNIGQGAQIIGPVRIADNVTIAAGAIVVEDIPTPSVTVAGIPAKTVK